MLKKLLLFFATLLVSASLSAESAGFLGASLGFCNTASDVAIYMAAPVLGMLVDSVKQCKNSHAHQQRAFDKAKRKQKELLALNEKSLKSKIIQNEVQKELQELKKPEKYSLKSQAKFFVKQLVTIVTDPSSALSDQPFFTSMLLLTIYRISQFDSKCNGLGKKEAKEAQLFGPDKQKIEHLGAKKEYENLPNWVTDSSSEGLTPEVITDLIQKKLIPKIDEGDKFSPVWERIAAAFAGCKGQKVPYLCLDGEPGVGKTRFAKELASALGYHCEVIECASVQSQSDNVNVAFKGLYRSYQNSAPGLILRALQKAKPKKGIVIVLDEIDKLPNPDVLLALIDPEQNNRFIDNYLEVPIDLSNVIFISTSNDWAGKIEARSAALASRLQRVNITSYSVAEKKEFVKKQIQENPNYASLKTFAEAETLITELIDEHDNVIGGLRKVVQLLDAAQSYYLLDKNFIKNNITKDQIKAKIKI